MKIIIKVKFNAESPRFENFGNNKYLAYLASEEGQGGEELFNLVSQKLAIPIKRIQFVKKEGSDVTLEI